MRINTALPAEASARRWVTLAVSAMTVVALGIAAAPALSEGQQKPAVKAAATLTAITVYKTPT